MDFGILLWWFFRRLTYPGKWDYFLAPRREECEEIPVKYSLEELSAIAVDCGYKLHINLAPGLLKRVYEALMANVFERQGLRVDRQKPIKIKYEDIELQESFRADLMAGERLLIELKSTERHPPARAKQVLANLRLLHLPLGFLMNFGSPTFKESCKRIVNNHKNQPSSRVDLAVGTRLASTKQKKSDKI